MLWFRGRTCANPLGKQVFCKLLELKKNLIAWMWGSRKMEFMCDSERLPANLRSKTGEQRVSETWFSVDSRKATIFALNNKQKGGPQLETLT